MYEAITEKPTEESSAATAWSRSADALADWTACMVNRDDVYGGYLPERYRKKTDANGKVTLEKTVTKPAKAKRGKVKLTRDIIARHYRGLDVGHVIGLHTTSAANTCKWFAIEIDAHDPADADAPARNLRAALHWRAKLIAAGFNVLMIDSNGAGGYHVLVILDGPAPSQDVFAFVQSIVADYKEQGFATAPETFPKQATIEPDKFGNWLRLFGRHHTRPHWSKILDSDQWLEGEAAINAILSVTPSNAKLIPPAPTPEIPEEPTPSASSNGTGKTKRRRSDANKDREIARDCVAVIPNNDAMDYHGWVRMGMAIHEVFGGSGEGLDLWIQWSAKSAKHQESECKRDWDCFSSGRGRAATLGTLVHHARQNGFDPFPPKGTDDPAAIENAREAIYVAIAEAYDAAEQEPVSSASAFDVAAHLATLSAAERSDAFAEFKSIFGSSLNLNDLRREVAKEEKMRRKGRRQVSKPSGLPEISTTDRQLRDISDDALHAIHAKNVPSPSIFTFAGEPARIRNDEHGTARPQALNESMMRGVATRSADFKMQTLDGPLSVSPPLDVVRDLQTRPDTDFPPLVAVVETPVIRPDGSIVTEPGYDPATCVFLSPRLGRPAIGPLIGTFTLAEAVALLKEPFADFPFDVDASRAGAFAMALGPFIRHAISGPAPMAVVGATSPGTGKGLCVSVASIISTGELPTLISPVSTEDEWSKIIIAMLSAGATFISIDNLEYPLRSAALSAALTSEIYTARELGRSRMLSVVQRATWATTGNNPILGGDIPRRCYEIGLDAHSQRAWMDRTFAHPDLLEWTRQNRHRIAAAILTICKMWFAAGKPAPATGTPIIGGFENWCKTTGGILHFAGINGFLGNINKLYESNDETANEWASFLAAWLERLKSDAVTVSHVATLIVRNEAGSMRDAMPTQLAKYLSDTTKFSQHLGLALRRYRGRRFGDEGLFIERGENDSATKVAKWSVKKHIRGKISSSKELISKPLTGTSVTSGTCSSTSHKGMHTFCNVRECACTRTHDNKRSIPHTDAGRNTPGTPLSPRNDQEPDDYERVERRAIQAGGM